MLKFELSLSAFKVIIPIMQAAACAFEAKKKLVKEKTIKIEKTRQHNRQQQQLDLYVHLGDNNQVVVSYAEEIW